MNRTLHFVVKTGQGVPTLMGITIVSSVVANLGPVVYVLGLCGIPTVLAGLSDWDPVRPILKKLEHNIAQTLSI